MENEHKLCFVMVIILKNTLILVAGMPGTGKTRFADYLSNELKIALICKDKLKEIVWDKVHYDTNIRSESQKYGALAYDLSYHFLEELMKTGHPVIFESNFVNTCTDYLKRIVEKYEYKVITVLFDGDIEIVHNRFIDRDITEERHPGLVSNNYFSDFQVFKNAVQPCRDFDYGDIRIVVDTSDFFAVSYNAIIADIVKGV